jgi:transcription-repair coupling factor (superfamily II helicase)
MSDLSQGFSLDDEDITVYTVSELFEIHHHKGRYENKFRNAEVIHAYEELEPGDYIVHATYGVGQYFGIETREIQGVKRDFLKCVYRGNAELLVPLEQFRLVRKFVSREGVVPRLNKLGSGDWEKTKKKLQENVEDIAAA